MKRYVFAIAYCIIAAISYAECTTITDTAVSISRWQEFYTPVYDGDMECWIVELQTNDPVLITYNVCLDLYSAFDYVNIFELDENNNVTEHLKHAWGVEEPGVIISTSNRFKVEYGGVTGNVDGTYEGFQLHFKKATQTHLTEHDYYIMGKVGIGTTHAKATLHVNGSIYGGEPFGATILKSKSGYVSIGTSMQQPTHMEFLTDRDLFIFNKPILNQTGILGSTTNTLQFTTNDSTRMAIVDGKIGIGTTNPQAKLHINGTIRGGGAYGSLQIKTSTGNLEFGPMDSGYSRFKTSMGGYHFDKKLILGTGELSSSSTLVFNTNYSTHCMTMLTNGNVGIGTTNPSYRLDVAGEIHADSMVLNGMLQAEEILVKLTGADFVFSDDYQLRPLSEVKDFIERNKHLPEIKSAQEMQTNGVTVNELQTQLLQKIEELTLYLIQQEQTILELRQEVEQLKK